MNVEIAERLAARRKLAGLSQEALAEKLGVSRQAVSKWERSESSPDTDNLISLAKLYGVSLDELLYVDDAIADDVAFEAADRAESQRGAVGTAAAPAADAAVGVEAGSATGDAAAAAADEDRDGVSFGPDGINVTKEGRGHVHVGPDGIHVNDGKDHVLVSWADGVHVHDRHGQEVHVGWDGVRVNTTDADVSDHIFTHGSFGDLDSDFARRWLKFPFWAIVIGVYLLIGLMSGAWWPGLFLLFLIPIYYIVGAAIVSRRVAPMLCGLYPLGATAWFFWMAFIVGQWHPAWVIFLTIPLVEVLIVKVSEAWHRRRGEEAADAEVVAEGEQ
ncbi:helix-turn-helix transcriptional regulator [Adlercreutzia sp. R21]|uniref:helix-turn-helix domain-containing protein n=1 Tax=Adlercreutzia wanghongyangiae TaxID=3111451 RepID=UPI002DB78DC9|nr:helix-turn-helix transcriptional regulator [Adlercreutzia sp. R21]MEC4183631.1 helix-turn-helix transcriptional regulator [Adlercreutzia sp. R21]